jgi:hypothetical protein
MRPFKKCAELTGSKTLLSSMVRRQVGPDIELKWHDINHFVYRMKSVKLSVFILTHVT